MLWAIDLTFSSYLISTCDAKKSKHASFILAELNFCRFCCQDVMEFLSKCFIISILIVTDPQALSDSGLERCAQSLNGLTKFIKFKELGTLMYGDPAQGPSIVSR